MSREEAGAFPEPILNLGWDYSDEEEADVIAREMNGYALVDFTKRDLRGSYKAGELIDWFNDLQTDGRTSSGNWLHCGQYNKASAADQQNYPDLITVVNGIPSINKARKRNNVDSSPNQVGLYSDWSWCWPRNRRIIYNRAAVDLDGNPWDAEHPVLAWNGTDLGRRRGRRRRQPDQLGRRRKPEPALHHERRGRGQALGLRPQGRSHPGGLRALGEPDQQPR